jgi:hypothetical protein
MLLALLLLLLLLLALRRCRLSPAHSFFWMAECC